MAMAEIGKPIARGPTLAAPQPASRNPRGAGTGPRRALERRPSGGQAHPEHTEDTLDAEHPPTQERGAAKPDAAAPRGYQAAMARPMASGARPALGGQRLPPRAAGTMPGTGSLNLQSNKEQGPPVFAAALSLLNMLTTGPAAAAQGTTAPHQQ